MIWVVVAIVVVIVVLAATMLNSDDSFKTAATELGMELSRSVPELQPRLDGMVDGIACKIDIAGSKELGVRYRAFYPALGMALRLERETTISRTMGQLGNGDQTIDAAEFDQKFRVNTSRPEAFKTMMTPDLRRRLIDLLDRYPAMTVADGEITLQTADTEPPATDIIGTMRELAAAARILDESRPAPLPAPEPYVRPATQVRPQPTPAAEKTPQPETTSAVTDEREAIQAAPKRPVTPQPTPVTPAAQPAVASGLPRGFFENAFGANRLSFEKDDQFDKIKGTTVTLAGKVKQSTTAVDDAGGTKVVVAVAEIENELYGKTDIDAVVYLQDAVDLTRGQDITFTGTADGIDAFMRNLFVTEARLLD